MNTTDQIRSTVFLTDPAFPPVGGRFHVSGVNGPGKATLRLRHY